MSTILFGIHVDTQTKKQCNLPFSIEEVSKVLASLKSGKTPGIDGLSPELLKVFWRLLQDPFYNMLNYSYEHRLLSPQLMKGIINLIPKAGKDQRWLKNLRPITLLCTDYKIIEKMISNRLMLSLETLISQDQKGFLPGRSISANIRRIFDVMAYCEKQSIDATILSLDFEKCFDKIEKTAILGSLRFFNFSEYIIDWVNMLYSGFTARIQNNGFFSESISIEKSVHQGGPASSALFLICAEVLAILLRSDEEIQGIPIDDIVNLLSQFADDMDIFLLFQENSLQACLRKLKYFHQNSGFTVNYDKTQVYRIGSLKSSDASLYTQENLRWCNSGVSVLGVQIDSDMEVVLKLNFLPLIEKAKGILQSWSNKSLSLLGKVCIINSLVASLFVYKMSVLPMMPKDMIKNLEESFERFLWNGHKPKISLRILQKSKVCGGLNLSDLRAKDISLKAKWKDILTTDSKLAKTVFKTLGCELGNDIWLCSLKENDVKYAIAHSEHPFWHDVLKSWAIHQALIPRTNKPVLLWFHS